MRGDTVTQRVESLKLRGSVHDVQYLFAGIRAILLLKSSADKEEVIASVRNEISEYNREFAEKYNLSKPRSIGPSLANDVIAILKSLGIVEVEEQRLRFSPLGRHLASLLENSQTREFRNEIAKLMLSKFSQLRSFLVNLYLKTTDGELSLPKVTAELLEVCKGDAKIMAEKIIEAVSTNLTEIAGSKLSSFELQKRLGSCLQAIKGKEIKSLEVAADQYLISNLMGPEITSERTYDIVRDQCTSMFLVNYGYFREGVLYSEVVYLTSWLYPEMIPPSNIDEFTDLDLGDDKRIRIHEPSSLAFKARFEEAVSKAYRNERPQFEFVKVSTLRKHVCRNLRISDRLFDSGIVELHQENPDRFSLSYSFEKVTAKRLPILLGDTVKTTYNLIHIKE